MPNIKLKDRNGNDVIYKDILSVTFDTEDGGTVTFYYGAQPSEPEEPTNTRASIVDDVLVLSNAAITSENVLELNGASIVDGYLIIDKEG